MIDKPSGIKVARFGLDFLFCKRVCFTAGIMPENNFQSGFCNMISFQVNLELCKMFPVNGEAPVAHEWGEFMQVFERKLFTLLGVALPLLQRINLYVINK